jgi:hypothetical protein
VKSRSPAGAEATLLLANRVERRLNRVGEIAASYAAIVEGRAWQLPLWSDRQRAMPNDYARSAIFTVRNRRTPRKNYSNSPIFVLGTCEITYTGIELRAEDDELVWLEVLNLARRLPLSAWVDFTPYGLCKALAWPTSSTYYQRVHNSLLRLKATAISVSTRETGRGMAVSMLDAYEWTDTFGVRLQRRRVRLNPAMASLFSNSRFVLVQWDVYRSLTPVARRLYDYATSHREPYPVLLENLRRMCGSDCGSRPRRWRQSVLAAMAELSSTGLLDGEIRKDLLHFHRPSSVQVRAERKPVVSSGAPLSTVEVRNVVS